ncbi:MAG: YncE family protein [Myxococcales bacterium]|nr:YncE family protein [Myxococcales bacterium]
MIPIRQFATIALGALVAVATLACSGAETRRDGRVPGLRFSERVPTLRVVGRTSLGASALTVALSDDGRVAYVVTHDSRGELFVIEKGAIKRRLRIAPRLGGVTLGGTRIYVTAAEQNKLYVIDRQRLVILRSLPTAGWPLSPTLSPDGRLLAIGCARGNSIAVYDVATLTPSVLRVGGHPFQMQFSRDNRRLFVTNYHDRSISVVSVDGRTRPVALKEEKRIRVGNGPIGIAISHDGALLYIANYSANNVSVLSIDDYGLIENVHLDQLRYPYGIQAAPGGGFFVSGSKTGEIVWYGALGEQRIFKIGAGVTNFVLTRNGRELYAADFGGHSLIRVDIEWTSR